LVLSQIFGRTWYTARLSCTLNDLGFTGCATQCAFSTRQSLQM
jgi:hypothetical protein